MIQSTHTRVICPCCKMHLCCVSNAYNSICRPTSDHISGVMLTPLCRTAVLHVTDDVSTLRSSCRPSKSCRNICRLEYRCTGGSFQHEHGHMQSDTAVMKDSQVFHTLTRTRSASCKEQGSHNRAALQGATIASNPDRLSLR